MRNWPYVHAALNKKEYPKVAGKVGVTPLPRWEDRAPVSVLGGHILVISAFSENPGAALKLVDYLSSADVVKQDAIDFSLAPALVDLWQDRDVQHALPAFSDLKSAVEDAKLRPETPNYPAISEAIHKNVNRALNGLAPEDALEAANDEMQQALDDAYREVAP
jgi:multiple sugar transport system substrate-binding protein